MTQAEPLKRVKTVRNEPISVKSFPLIVVISHLETVTILYVNKYLVPCHCNHISVMIFYHGC